MLSNKFLLSVLLTAAVLCVCYALLAPRKTAQAASGPCGTVADCAQKAVEAAQAAQALAAVVKKSGMVVAFATTTCPTPWVAYQQAAGRFIRGIDPSGSHELDPDGLRAPGSLQGDGVKSHTHKVGVNGADSTTMLSGGGAQRLAHFNADGYGAGAAKDTSANDPNMVETRPKNVALLYCTLP